MKPLIQRESQLDHSGIPMVLRTLIEYLEFDSALLLVIRPATHDIPLTISLLPMLVPCCATDGLDTVGLFRIPGTASTMTKLRSEFNQQGGDGVNLKLKQAKVHDIAGLLKMFFRDLPECLCTYDLVDAFIATQSTNWQSFRPLHPQVSCLTRICWWIASLALVQPNSHESKRLRWWPTSSD